MMPIIHPALLIAATMAEMISVVAVNGSSSPQGRHVDGEGDHFGRPSPTLVAAWNAVFSGDQPLLVFWGG